MRYDDPDALDIRAFLISSSTDERVRAGRSRQIVATPDLEPRSIGGLTGYACNGHCRAMSARVCGPGQPQPRGRFRLCRRSRGWSRSASALGEQVRGSEHMRRTSVLNEAVVRMRGMAAWKRDGGAWADVY